MTGRRMLRQAGPVLCAAAVVAPAAQAKFPDYGAVPQTDQRPIVIDRRPIVVESGRFDWAEAGIGAASAAGFMLVGGGAVTSRRLPHEDLPRQ